MDRLGRLARHEAFSYIGPSSLKQRLREAETDACGLSASMRMTEKTPEQRPPTEQEAKHRPGPRPKTHAGQRQLSQLNLPAQAENRSANPSCVSFKALASFAAFPRRVHHDLGLPESLACSVSKLQHLQPNNGTASNAT